MYVLFYNGMQLEKIFAIFIFISYFKCFLVHKKIVYDGKGLRDLILNCIIACYNHFLLKKLCLLARINFNLLFCFFLNFSKFRDIFIVCINILLKKMSKSFVFES